MKLTLIIATVALLSACTIHADLPTRMIIDSDGIVIDSKGSSNNKYKNKQRFCPPGQAKKGNC